MRQIVILFAVLCLLFEGIVHAQWVKTSEPYEGADRLTVFDSTIIAKAYGVIEISTDLGETWEQRDGHYLDFVTPEDFLFAKGELFVPTSYSFVYRSLDTGRTWQPIIWNQINNEGQGLGNLCAVGDTFLTYKFGQGLMRSKDRGVHWDTLNRLVDMKVGYDSSVTRLRVDGVSVYASATLGGVFHSSDAGLTWDTGIPGINAPQLNLDDTIFYDVAAKGSLVYGASLHGVYRSRDSAKHWEFSSDGIGRQDVRSLCIAGTKVFAGLNHQGGVYASSDSGVHWVPWMEGMTPDGIFGLTSAGPYIFAAGDAGVWRRPISDPLAVTAVSLSQSRDSLSISCNGSLLTANFTLRQSTSQCNLQLYDVLGHPLLSQDVGAWDGGWHTMSFEVGDFPTGYYVIRLVTPSGVVSESFLLTR